VKGAPFILHILLVTSKSKFNKRKKVAGMAMKEENTKGEATSSHYDEE